MKERDIYEGDELCPNCNHENHFIWEEGTPRRIRCEKCNEEMFLCNICNREFDCSKCPY